MAYHRIETAPGSPFEGVRIHEGEIELRPLTVGDARALFTLIDADRARLGRWLPWVEDTRTERDSARFIANAADERRRRRSLVLGLRVRAELVGTVGLHYVEWFDSSAEVGYWIAARAEGRGYVTRATRALLEFAFGVAGLNRIVLRCAVGNERSRCLAGRLGFREEGVMREAHCVGGQFLDQHLYALLRREFTMPGEG